MQQLQEQTDETSHGTIRARLTECDESSEEDDRGYVDNAILDDLLERQKSDIRITMSLTIRRRCFFCFREYNGARICFDGRSQTNILVSDSHGQL